jgi:hypothetical protein
MAAIAWLCCLFVQVIHKILLNRLAIIRQSNDGRAALPWIELPTRMPPPLGTVTRLKITSWLAGAIKLPFRKINSVLCEQRA